MKKQSFDQALQRLEEIVEQLESGQLGLEESLARFEEGVRISMFCQEELQKTDGKVSLLMKKMNGEMELLDFEA
ncbi:MAG TPA: exodeoxyribonuclease VII small subunit [Syntrophomonas sp.]|nr:exodeoxyribonuclease VII small subunit [Syntrophomonas sp.]HRW12381.1 exodeoxyribonuclease VII small subunit [Syntrophomonas sp.]